MRGLFVAAGGVSIGLVACIANVDATRSSVLTDPNDPSRTVSVAPGTAQICGTICDALIEDYGVPPNLRSSCVFECAVGFEAAPDACYELVACVADKTLCSANDVSPSCLARANDCLARWSLANGSCRGCWQPSRTVHGKQIVTFISEGTPSSDPRPEDFSGKAIAALLPRPSGDPYRFPGVGRTDGTYEIPNVPGCGVWIQIGNQYTWASNADVDTSYLFPGRTNAKLGSLGTSLTFQITNMVPWQHADWLEGFIPQLGNYVNGFLGGSWAELGNEPADGATSYDLVSDLAGNALVDASQGDVVYLANLATDTRADGTLVRTVKRAARITGLTSPDGVATNVPVALVDVAATKSLRVDWRRGTFEALKADLHPASAPGYVPRFSNLNPVTLDVWTHPDRKQVGPTAELVLVTNPFTSGDVAPFDVSFGTPYDASWGIDVDIRATYHVVLTDRAGATHVTQEMFELLGPFDRLAGSPLAARLGTPRNIRINGASAFVAQNGGTLTPAIEWDPPALGTPTTYRVVVVDLAGTGAALNRPRDLFTFVIPSLPGETTPSLRRFVLPPGILERGKDYTFRVMAESTGTDEITSTAPVVTAEYRP